MAKLPLRRFPRFLPSISQASELLRARVTYETFGFEGWTHPPWKPRVFQAKRAEKRAHGQGAEARGGLERPAWLARPSSPIWRPLRPDRSASRYYRATPPSAAVTSANRSAPYGGRSAQTGLPGIIQCDVDVLGSASMAVEAEVILATATALAGLGFEDLRVRLNSRPLLHLLVRSAGIAEALVGAAVIGIDKLDKESAAAVREELVGKGIPAGAASCSICPPLPCARRERSLADVSAGRGGGRRPPVPQIRDIIALTRPCPSGPCLDPSSRVAGTLHRPISSRSDGIPFSLGGGRFDDLIERLAGAKVPACGFSIGFERVYTLMEERGLFTSDTRGADVLVAISTPDVVADALRLATELRAAGLRVDVFPHAAKLGAQFDLAERKRIPYAIVADAQKLSADTLEVRELATRQSTPVARAELAAWLRGRLIGAGFKLIGDRATAAPHVVTIELPPHIRSDDAARALERTGFLLSYASGYLRERNWIQICLMGKIGRAHV